MKRSNSYLKAEQEFKLLEEQTPDAIVLEFKKEILNLVDKFGKSGQSGGSAPYVASIIKNVVGKLLLQQPIAPLTNKDDEWVDVTEYSPGDPMFQNKRNSAVFKNGKEAKPWYLDAIAFRSKNPEDGEEYTFTGSVYTDSSYNNILKSNQEIKEFPFEAQTFYLDVVSVTVDSEDDYVLVQSDYNRNTLKQIAEMYNVPSIQL